MLMSDAAHENTAATAIGDQSTTGGENIHLLAACVFVPSVYSDQINGKWVIISRLDNSHTSYANAASADLFSPANTPTFQGPSNYANATINVAIND